MSDLSRHRPYLIGGAVAIGLAVLLVSALVPRGTWMALDRRRSSARVTPDGVAAWAHSLERLGVPVAPRYRSFVAEAPRGATLVLLEPRVLPSVAEAHAVLEWVRAGGSLVYSPSPGSLIADSLGIRVPYRSIDRLVTPLARDSLSEHRWSAPGLTGTAVSSWTLSADRAVAGRWEVLAMTGEDRLPTVVWLPEGEGGVVILADAQDLANGSLDESVGAIAVTRAVVDRTPPGDTVFFSEFHQGLDGRRGLLRETLAIAGASPLGRVALHLALASFLLLIVLGRRFGSPAPEPEGGRRSALEHVEALGDIYRGARAHGTVARRLVRGAARRMGLPPSVGGDVERTLMAWATRPDLAEPGAAALAALRSNPPHLEALERALDTVVSRHALSFRRP